MDVDMYSEPSVTNYQTTRRHVPKTLIFINNTVKILNETRRDCGLRANCETGFTQTDEKVQQHRFIQSVQGIRGT